ncbi:MAG: DUF3575 domain-containing protein [Flavobacteriaceae bacterium]|nr:DUF3575 domain-containing protein [Flavobacteriaceae bacterium]
MKKIVISIITLLLFSTIIFAQSEEKPRVKQHELKANAFNLIVFKAVDFSYEYLIDSESSVGASLLFNLQDPDDDSYADGPYYNEKFAFTPYYRRYFSSKHAWGFFIDAFGMYNVQKNYDGYYDYNNNVYINSSNEESNNIAFGIAVGAKFVSRNGFIFEFFGGAGRNIYSSNEDFATEIVPRLGATLGYRF